MATRQRQVFPRDEVAHLWAHKAQDSARDSSGNFYFTGPTIYSYGSHFAIAHILADECGPDLGGRVLWNDAKHSNTTAKHKSIVWRAMTRQQKDNELCMPESIGMGRNVDPHHIERDLIAKRLPGVTPLLIDRVIECISELQKKKRDGGPFAHLVHEAKKAETLATLFYKRAKKKYPLPIIGDIPTDKAELLAWIKVYAASKMREEYAEAMKQANHYAQQARINATECTDGFPYAKHAPGCQWEARNIVSGTYDAAQKAINYCNTARALYVALNPGKKPAAMDKLKNEMAPIAAIFEARRDEFNKAEARNRVVYYIRDAAISVRNLRDSIKKASPAFSRRFSDMATLPQRAKDAGLTDTLYLPLAHRFGRIGAAMEAHHTLDRAAYALSVAESYIAGAHHGDVIRHASDAIEKIAYIGRLDIATGLRAKMHAQITEILSKARSMRDASHAIRLAAEADRLRVWIAGESNIRPAYDVGTYARINGQFVETTRGANVPVEHACRLSRLYAIAVRRGGQSWADGNGPMVGHYRVNHIGADGALVIGCHEFTPAEAKRLHALLESCEACATVAIEA